ncbi:MAG: tRNA (N(6)-L-threonylcarbamoyladenosine(37)-C(2))-methylthiotransferase MtaB [Moorella humiferrea]|uniref:Threonylcarbamoyladenosine tRNA methylthiotransferase MtaB n=2 Tax=Neomoorella humiferrea TaxID=676965 RepID=A0A2T0AW17_9FIRM|nr:tRNA (N(6)-L-threonylcarbamoyladenosine(37)-C(2))-methylthiotransferase MtaB [Moorella humiferrea]MBE3573440.1 tRNA (N(6)-L-threonylcarbamoyladenosine(37)-C(2))-methylthiotransferase MtaB [Moorella humiferrea]PRR74929.1 Threonylcarbamoyladenosine tRNA methylthiotransferase MtaB [Moorella humiferrea]
MPSPRVALVSLGCKVNQNELEAMKHLFREAGYEIVPFSQKADVYVVHTCTVTHISDRKSRQYIRRARRANPDAVVAVTGCYAQVAPGEVMSIPGVDVIIGTRDRRQLVELVEKARREGITVNAVRPHEAGEAFEELPLVEVSRARAFLKIQEGCEEFCTYCIVPYARGPFRSRAPEAVLKEVQRLVAAGYLEIVLTGVHTGAYGRDLPGGPDLAGLLRQIVQIPGLKRLRISSIDPLDFTPDLKEVLTGEEIICPHYHIPLQSGDDEILRRMGRRYDARYYLDLIASLRARRPRAAFTSDVMVGFPGETEEQFQNTMRVVKEAGLAAIHVFPYSPRRGTPAAAMPDQVDPAVKKERERRLLQLGRKLSRQYAREFLQETMEVLVERALAGRPGVFEGHTGNYLQVAFPAAADPTGSLVAVRLEELRGSLIWGKLVQDVNAGRQENGPGRRIDSIGG